MRIEHTCSREGGHAHARQRQLDDRAGRQRSDRWISGGATASTGRDAQERGRSSKSAHPSLLPGRAPPRERFGSRVHAAVLFGRCDPIDDPSALTVEEDVPLAVDGDPVEDI